MFKSVKFHVKFLNGGRNAAKDLKNAVGVRRSAGTDSLRSVTVTTGNIREQTLEAMYSPALRWTGSPSV